MLTQYLRDRLLEFIGLALRFYYFWSKHGWSKKMITRRSGNEKIKRVGITIWWQSWLNLNAMKSDSYERFAKPSFIHISWMKLAKLFPNIDNSPLCNGGSRKRGRPTCAKGLLLGVRRARLHVFVRWLANCVLPILDWISHWITESGHFVPWPLRSKPLRSILWSLRSTK